MNDRSAYDERPKSSVAKEKTIMLRKEREVAYLIEKYLDNIKEWQKTTSEAVLSYYMEDLDALKLAVLSKNQFQTAVETERQHIWKKLCDGAYMPAIRGSLFGIATEAGRVANSATACCEMFFFEKPLIPQELSNAFSSATESTFNLFKPVYDSILQYLRGVDVVRTISRNTEEFWEQKEQIVLLEDDLKRQLSVASLDAWHKTQLNICAQSISTVSGRITEMEDGIQMIIAKLVS